MGNPQMLQLSNLLFVDGVVQMKKETCPVKTITKPVEACKLRKLQLTRVGKLLLSLSQKRADGERKPEQNCTHLLYFPTQRQTKNALNASRHHIMSSRGIA